MRFFERLMWIAVVVGAGIGGLILLATMATANGAPQEAAGAALAVAMAVLPYVTARAFQRGLESPEERELKRLSEKLQLLTQLLQTHLHSDQAKGMPEDTKSAVAAGEVHGV